MPKKYLSKLLFAAVIGKKNVQLLILQLLSDKPIKTEHNPLED